MTEHQSNVTAMDEQPVNDEVEDEETKEPVRLTVVSPEPRLTVNREPVAAKDEEKLTR